MPGRGYWGDGASCVSFEPTPRMTSVQGRWSMPGVSGRLRIPLRRSRMLDGRDLERILDVTRQLARSLDLTAMLEMVIEAARTVLHADRGTVFLYDPATDEL